VHKLLLAVFCTPMRCQRLESERISSSTTVAHPKSRVKLVAVIAVVAVSVVVGAFIVSAFISAPPEGQDAWLFKGAYATYKGSMTSEDMDIDMSGLSMSFDFSVDFTVRLEVLDFNDTHALISASFEMSSSFGEMDGEKVEDESSAWVPLSEMGFMTDFNDVDLTTSYESTVNIDGFGTRTCMVYEYAISDEGMAMTVYVDKAIGWPLKMAISSDENDLGLNLALDIKLTETNISALK
jgi:hypothetical protein